MAVYTNAPETVSLTDQPFHLTIGITGLLNLLAWVAQKRVAPAVQQRGQTWVRTLSDLSTRSGHRLPSGKVPLQSWLVNWGGTAMQGISCWRA